MITLTTLGWVPPFARGLVRDMRARWALEEAGLPYRVELIDPDVQASPAYRERQPFGQVPVLEEDGLVLFESGAIVLHIAERSEVLMPRDAAGRARTVTWVLAALDSVEVVVQALAALDLFHSDARWAQEQRPLAEQAVEQRLAELSAWLGERDYLEGRFTAGDLMMTTVLRILRHTELVAAHPTLAAYQHRCEARPAFQRALRDHMAVFAPG